MGSNRPALGRPLLGLLAAFALSLGCSSTPTPSVESTKTSSPTVAAAPSTSAPPLAPVPSATPGGFPATILGLPIHTVSEARELIGSGKAAGRLIAVSGYWSQEMIPCPSPQFRTVMDGFCTGTRFEDDYQTPEPGLGDPNIIVAPESADSDLLYQSQGQGEAGKVVVIGHTHDSRSWQCEPDQRDECLDKLVIDRVVWANGKEQDLGSPNSAISLSQLNMTPDQAAAAAVEPGEQILTAYPTDTIDLNDVDPRLLGFQALSPYQQGLNDLVWYVRVLTGQPDADGTSDGAVRLVDDVTAKTLTELSIDPGADYRPARLVFELGPGTHGDFGSTNYPRVQINANGTPLYSDYLSGGSPVTLDPGIFALHGYVGNQDGYDVGGATCDTPISLDAEANVAYIATFTKTGCSWTPAPTPS